MLWNSAGSITVLACQWLLTIVVVRLSGDYEAAGVLSLALAVYNIFAPISVYRMYVYQVSDVKRENTTGEYLTFRLVTTAIALTALIAYAASSRHYSLRALSPLGAHHRGSSRSRSTEWPHGLHR